MLKTTILKLSSPRKLTAAMEKSGKSTRRIADEARVARSRVAQLARGHVPSATASTAVALADALDVPVADLFEFPDGEALVRLGLIRNPEA